MDILTSSITEEALIQEQHLIAEYIKSYKEEQVRILDENFYAQYNENFTVDRDRDFIGDEAEVHFKEEYDFLY
jgi:hypothetical protein